MRFWDVSSITGQHSQHTYQPVCPPCGHGDLPAQLSFLDGKRIPANNRVPARRHLLEQTRGFVFPCLQYLGFVCYGLGKVYFSRRQLYPDGKKKSGDRGYISRGHFTGGDVHSSHAQFRACDRETRTFWDEPNNLNRGKVPRDTSPKGKPNFVVIYPSLCRETNSL